MRSLPGSELLRPIPRARWLTLWGVLAGVLIGCGGDPPETAPGGGDADHVLEASAIQIVGSGEALTLVRGLEVADDGTIWVLDDRSPFLTAFSAEGEVLLETGEQGDGPGEFTRPVALVRTSGSGAGDGSGIWAYDAVRHAFVRVSDPDGGVPDQAGGPSVALSRDDLPAGGFLPANGGIPGMFPWMASSGASVFVAHPAAGEPPRGTGFWRAEVVEVALPSGDVGGRWAMDAFLPDPEAHHPGATEFAPTPLWAFCSDGSGWVYDPADHRVRPMDDPGAEGRSLLAPRQVAFSLERLLDLLVPTILAEVPSAERPPEGELRVLLASEIGQTIDAFAEIFPEYFQMKCAPDGALWLQHFDWSEGRGGASPVWERVGPGEEDGSPTLLRFPDRFQVFRIDSGRAWGIVLDELDVPSVAWVDLP